MSPRKPLTLTEIGKLKDGVCPDCGGTHLLRGPTSTANDPYAYWTCGDCQEGYKMVALVALRIGPQPPRAAFYDANQPEKKCEREECGKAFHGPSLYCCIGCAIEDA